MGTTNHWVARELTVCSMRGCDGPEESGRVGKMHSLVRFRRAHHDSIFSFLYPCDYSESHRYQNAAAKKAHILISFWFRGLN